jgi:hypothetical protein
LINDVLGIDYFHGAETFLNFNAVREQLKHTISQLLQDISAFSSSDILVSLDADTVVPISEGYRFEPNANFLAIYAKASKMEKESGVFPLCCSRGFVEWKYQQDMVRSPLFLLPCEINFKNRKEIAEIVPEVDNLFFNPFLYYWLKESGAHDLPSEDANAQEWLFFLTSQSYFSVNESAEFLGNFHHHRFAILKELEGLKDLEGSSSLAQVFGESDGGELLQLELSNELLFPADLDQLAVFDAFNAGNTVVQGPPGTGKSQVLANVLGKVLGVGKSSIVVSEKRVALEVLQKKMQQCGLGDLCFIASSEIVSKAFLKALHESWLNLEQARLQKPPTNLLLSEQYLDQLQQQLDILNGKELIGGVSFQEFDSLLAGRSWNDVPFRSDLPTLDVWLTFQENIQQLYALNVAQVFGKLAPGIWKDPLFKELDRLVLLLQEEMHKLRLVFELETWLDVQRAMKKSALCQTFSSAFFRKYENVLQHNSKEQKRFLKLRKKYVQQLEVNQSLSKNGTQWKKKPSRIEVELLRELAQISSFSKRWKFKKLWRKYSDFPLEQAVRILDFELDALQNSALISQLKTEFCEIGIDDVENELEMVFQQVHAICTDDWELWLAIPQSERTIYAAHNALLHAVFSRLKTFFSLEDTTRLEDVFSSFLVAYPHLFELHESLKDIPISVQRACGLFPDVDGFELAVCKSNWIKFTAQFTAFKDFEPNDLIKKSHTIGTLQQEESAALSHKILHQQLEKFRFYHDLLQAPIRKLTPLQRELRSALKRGKSILVKEFAKTRNHPSLRELFASDAQLWIRLLKPIWLSNPTQIAKCFPLQMDLFDVAIFDEASQIPLQNALGTLHRAKRVLIAGDQQQMGPSSFFKMTTSETVDVLHQASFYWKNVRLKHHYRSENPELIAFSNHFFYANELLAYPSFFQETHPIVWHYISDGVFENRKNSKEAVQIAEVITQIIHSSDRLGIVAFSEVQLAEIYSKLAPTVQELLLQRIESDTLFFKALENVQGEECDYLLVSFGYGKNETGEFHHRFGPLNGANGARRLNVLLSRACKKISFFTSVKAADFRITSTESVNLLRQFLVQLERQNVEPKSVVLPFCLQPEIDGNILRFSYLHANIPNAVEFVTFVRVMESRGWIIDWKK